MVFPRFCFLFYENSLYARTLHLPPHADVADVEAATVAPAVVEEPQPPLPPPMPPTPVKLVSVQVVVSENVCVKLNVRLQCAVAIDTEVIVAVLTPPPVVIVVVPPGAVTVVLPPGSVTVEVEPPTVMVVVSTLPGPWTVVVDTAVIVWTPPGPWTVVVI